jgi:hypothetical protein
MPLSLLLCPFFHIHGCIHRSAVAIVVVVLFHDAVVVLIPVCLLRMQASKLLRSVTVRTLPVCSNMGHFFFNNDESSIYITWFGRGRQSLPVN